VAEFEAGASGRELARKHGLHRTTVTRTLREAGVSSGQRTLGSLPDLVTECRSLRDSGATLRAIGTAVGISHQSVMRVLVKT
jgi:lambda repressor-like predicted transcriptional regulator